MMKEVRAEIKKLIIAYGFDGILNKHITQVVEKTGCTYCDTQNAMSYFRYSPQQKTFRESVAA